MKVLSRSHRLGRLDHGVYGGQAGADPARVLAAMKLPEHRIHSLLLEPGDVAFTHSNLLHCSAPNLSDDWRRNVIVAFSSRENSPVPGIGSPHHAYSPIAVLDDGALRAGGACRRLDPAELEFLAFEEKPAAAGAARDEL